MVGRRIGRVGVALALALAAAAGCGDDSAAGPDSFEPVVPGVLTVVTSLPAPGFWDGTTVDDLNGGFEWGIATELADSLGLRLEVRDVDFGDLVSGRVEDFDVGFSQVTVTDERSDDVDFTTAYYTSDFGVLVRAGTDVPDLATARDKSWVVRADTTNENFVRDVIQPDDVVVVETFDEMLDALAAHEVDAALLDTPLALAEAHASNGELDVVAQFAAGERWAGVLPNGSDNRMALDLAIRRLDAQGKLGDLADEWLDPVLGEDPSDVPFITAKEPRR